MNSGHRPDTRIETTNGRGAAHGRAPTKERKTKRAGASGKPAMSLFACADFRAALGYSFERAAEGRPGLTWASLAQVCDVSPSFVSKVRSGRGVFRPEALELLAPLMAWDDDELAFCEVLAEKWGTSVPERLRRLERRMADLRRVHLDVARHLDKPAPAEPAPDRRASGRSPDHGPHAPDPKPDPKPDPTFSGVYHSDPLNVLVHMALTIPAYRSDPALLARELDISMTALFGILATLETAGFVAREGGAWIPRQTSLHLPRASPAFRRWSASVRHMCADRVARRASPDDFLFSVTFSASQRERDAIRDALLAVLRDAEGRVDGAGEERLYQLNLDLFTWLEGA